uniref:Uncharacterized protein n=1 Tax=Arundo donax TaxID=35708 RepID=A0A0A8ZD61_ARUDO
MRLRLSWLVCNRLPAI